MRTAVDSSVLLDILLNDPEHCTQSSTSLRQAQNEGAIFVCEVVVAEITPMLGAKDLESFFLDLDIQFIPSSLASSLLAGEMFSRYLARSRTEHRRVVADFIIGAHAVSFADRLLTRDRGFYRDYFKNLEILK